MFELLSSFSNKILSISFNTGRQLEQPTPSFLMPVVFSCSFFFFHALLSHPHSWQRINDFSLNLSMSQFISLFTLSCLNLCISHLNLLFVLIFSVDLFVCLFRCFFYIFDIFRCVHLYFCYVIRVLCTFVSS